MRVKRKYVGLILKKIWNSELNIWFGWSRDGDIQYTSDGESVVNTGQQNMEVGLEKMCKDLVRKYPSSEFSHWFMKTFNYNPYDKK